MSAWKPGLRVEVLTLDYETDKPTWVGGFEYVRTVDDTYIRVRQLNAGPGCNHTTTWTHDRVRVAVEVAK